MEPARSPLPALSALQPLLTLRGLGVRQGREILLDGVALDVRRGSIHVVVGPNGGGKSTLLTAILGRIAFTGSITALWQSAGRIGYLPQSFAVDRTLPVTVSDFLALSRQRRPVCFGIERGTRQRVLLANAIDPTPELLLLDEPAAGLDEMAIGQMEEILLGLKGQAGLTALMVSHDLAQVRRLADRVTLLNRSVQRDGPPAEVLTADLPETLLAARWSGVVSTEPAGPIAPSLS
jgi:zinc transport system ATP-binding protein